MLSPRDIDTAISAHSAWKDRLKKAIALGELDTPVDLIKADNQCLLGKWLHGPAISNGEKTSPTFREILQLHADFHKCAARIAGLASAGKRDEALDLLETSGKYTTISQRLIAALSQWKQSLSYFMSR